MSTRGAWTTDEDAVLRSMYETHTRREIAERLGRTIASVRKRCSTLRLATKVVPWSDVELAILTAAYVPGSPVAIAALARRLGKLKSNVCRKARSLGLTDGTRSKAPPEAFASSEEWKRHLSESMKARIASNGHPRGALGIRHNPKTRAQISASSKRAWADPDSSFNSASYRQGLSDRGLRLAVSGALRNGYSRGAAGRREDLGIYVRSSWEANYARYLTWRVGRGELLSWEYEPKTFVFETIKRGTRSYTPDFLLTFADGRQEWHEVKGWMDPKSATRLKRMARYFPSEVVRVIDKHWFRDAVRSGLAATIPNWERGGKRPSRKEQTR